MSRAEEALASLMKSVSPAGSRHGRQLPPFHCSATGAPSPPGLVPPNAHASARPSAITEENPDASAAAP